MVARLAAALLGGANAGSSWRKGAAGERKVARRLDGLSRNEWMPLHDKPLGPNGRNVDHLLIGTGGVFSVNTKNLSGKVVVKRNAFLVNGHAGKELHVARNEAHQVGMRLSAILGAVVPVTPVLVVLAPSFEVQAQPDDVVVLGLRDVPGWFESRPRVLALHEASRLYGISRRSNVWLAPVDSLRRDEATKAASVEGLTIRPWKAWGHDRLYVNDAHRNALGYLDRKSGQVHVVDPARSEDVMTMLQPHLCTS